MKKYRLPLLLFGLLLVLVATFYAVGNILLPFVIGLLVAYLASPVVKRVQRLIPNRNLAVTLLLVVTLAFSAGTLTFFGAQLVNDFQRLNNAFSMLLEQESETIDSTTATVKSYLEDIYVQADLDNQLQLDSLGNALGDSTLNMETIQSTAQNVMAFFESDAEADESPDRGYNWFLILLYSAGYCLYIIYTYEYFETRIARYTSKKQVRNAFLQELIHDFNATFTSYFRQRTQVVILCAIVFTATFLIMGMPGAILLGVFAGLLCYIAQFHYIALIPLALTCWALSVEQGNSFFLYFGIVVGIFIVISVLEELVFFPYIMKDVANMNPAIMLLSFALWPALLGTIGLFLALPLTSVVLLLIKRVLAIAEGLADEAPVNQ